MTLSRRYALALASALAPLIGLVVGCDTTPSPPTDVPPSVSKEIPPEKTASGKPATRSIKNRPTPPPAAPEK